MSPRLVLVAAAALAGAALAHKPSDSYLTLRPDGARVVGRWDLALRDLDAAVGLDADGDGAISWGDVLARRAAVLAELSRALRLSQRGESCPWAPGAWAAVRHSDGVYLVVPFEARCPGEVDALEVRYSFLFALDAQHRGLLRLEGAGEAITTFHVTQPQRTVTFARVSWPAQLWLAFREGVHHLAIGFDHLAFLFALLLPAVLRRRDGAWAPVDSLRGALLEVLKVVTSFTLAHSLTLALAAFGVVAPEMRWVEVAIAASVALAAFNNLVPWLPEGRWALAFGLGLLHGFGFSSALADLGAQRLALTVLGFNLGVEAGQVAIVAAFVPLAYRLRGLAGYQLLLRGGSAAILGVAAFWVAERL